MRKRSPLRFGIVGAGGIARAHAEAIMGKPGVKLLAIVDIQRHAAQGQASVAGCKAFDTVENMVSADPIDAAIVCTPPAVHETICLDLLKSGVHVLCEKPLSTNPASAQLMVDAARDADRTLMVSSKYLYVKDVDKGKKLIDCGRIGKLLWIDIVFTASIDMSANWRSDPNVSGGGVLMDNGPHVIDIVDHLAGPISEVHAIQFPSTGRLRVEETVLFMLQTASGVICRAHLSWNIHEPAGHYARISGSKGVIELGWQRSTFYPAALGTAIPIGPGYDKASAFRRQLSNFCRIVRSKRSLGEEFEDMTSSMKVLRAAYRSMAERRWVPVRE